MRYQYALFCWLAIVPVSCGGENPAGNDDPASIRVAVLLFDDGAAGVDVGLYRGGAAVADATAATDENGVVEFGNLEPGTYEVALNLSTDYEIAEEDEARKSITTVHGRKERVAFYLTLLVTDIDGNRYRTTKIGDQIWTAENLRVSRFRNGDPIPEVQADADWKQARLDEAPAWSNYNNDPDLGAAYGKLYNNYAAVDPRGICPAGWHVPSEDEVRAMERSIGVPADQLDVIGWRGGVGGKIRSTRTKPEPHPRWSAPNEGATNDTGLSLVGTGYRNGNPLNALPEGFFNNLQLEGVFYTSTSHNSGHLARAVALDKDGVYRNFANGHGFAVRCLKD